MTEHLLIPFTGSQREIPENDSFNYHLSQLRIRIEMSFGRMVTKFRIFKWNLCGYFQKHSRVIMACDCLHNYIIVEDGYVFELNDVHIDIDDIDIVPFSAAPLGMGYITTLPDDGFEVYFGVSHAREGIVQLIKYCDIRHPIHNIRRNINPYHEGEDDFQEFYHPV